MTMIADTLYSLLARKLRGFENCDASKIYRLFVKGKARVCLSSQTLTVTFPQKPQPHPALCSLASIAPVPFVAERGRVGSQI
jgi:hypothetical protein